MKTAIEKQAEKDAKKEVTREKMMYIKNLMQSRVYSAYTKGRKDPRVFYQPSITKREWWRQYVNEYPVPGTYACRDFLDIQLMNPVQATYNFRGQGRDKKAGVAPQGELLLPGAYEHKDLLQNLDYRQAATAFKSSGRNRTPTGFQDKDLYLPPWQYSLIRVPVKKQRVKHSAFKSQSARFPTQQFQAKDGPPPGSYNPCQPQHRYAISSSFNSETARFRTSHTKVPGPGTYDPTIHKTPQIPTLRKMGRMHGLFFSNKFKA